LGVKGLGTLNLDQANERGDAWIATYTGGRFWPLAPQADDVHPTDIAHALAMTCRYGGHVAQFYSVAEHSVLVSQWLEREGASRDVQLIGLLHDAAEAYLPDVAKPIKPQMPEFRSIESAVLATVFERFGLPPRTDDGLPEPVKHADLRILVDEGCALMARGPGCWPSLSGVEPLDVPIEALDWRRAKQAFLNRLAELGRAP